LKEDVMRKFLVCLSVVCFSLSAGAQQLDTRLLAEKVRSEFVHAWNGYKKYAWGYDGYRPLSKTAYNWNTTPMYLTALEALDTMTLMGLTEEADSTREFLATHLRFDSDQSVDVFEITIRAMGSLLSNYELTGDTRLLNLADSLGTHLLPAFITGSGLPYRMVNLKTGAVSGQVTNPGEAGTLLLEFGTLSMLTGKPKYYNHAKIALLQLYDVRSPLGLVGDAIDVTTSEWKSTDSHLSACIDSYYEYLLKAGILFNDQDCQKMWTEAYAAINAHLLDSSRAGFWYGHANMNTGKRTKTWFGALDAFFPAVQVLAGDLPRAKRLMNSCYAMWTKNGIEPEQYNYATGLVEKPRYFLNPEIMESAYYLYRATGDSLYLRMGVSFLEGLMTYCRTDEGYAELNNVITKEKMDRMEPYFMAETMKYLYLLFAPPETLPFEKVIFTTEAHPLQKGS
jgi:mannosidase alpha-like ER degradation enhancer 2